MLTYIYTLYNTKQMLGKKESERLNSPTLIWASFAELQTHYSLGNTSRLVEVVPFFSQFCQCYCLWIL